MSEKKANIRRFINSKARAEETNCKSAAKACRILLFIDRAVFF